MVRRTRVGGITLVAALVGLLLSLFGASLASAQTDSARGETLTIREIDGTNQDAVQVTFLWTGDQASMAQNLVLRERGASKDVALSDLRDSGRALGTVFVVDLSGSMSDNGALAAVKEGISAFAADLPEGDQVGVIGFTSEVTVESGLTGDPAQVEAGLAEMTAPRDAQTALYDGLKEASSMLDARPNLQPNIVLVTDGRDDSSIQTRANAQAALVRTGAALFSVEITHKGDELDPGAISSIVERTGGAQFSAGDAAGIATAFTNVRQGLASQYIATYASGVDQGEVEVTLAVGTTERTGSFVAGGRVQGGNTAPVAAASKPLGPDWLRSSTGILVALLFVGLSVGGLAYAFANLATKDSGSLESVLSPYHEGGVSADDNDGALAQTAILQRAVEMTEDFAERQGFLQRVEGALERADLPLRAAEAIFFYLIALLVLGVGSLFMFGLIQGLIVTAILAVLPIAVVNFMARRRSKKFEGQLPDMLHLLSGSLRAGYSLMQGVEAVSQEVTEPMGKELRRVVTEARLGRELEDSMEGVGERMDSPDFMWAVMAIRIQREVGGNLSELLLTVAETMVQRERLRRDVSSLTAEGRMSAIILGLLPMGLGLFIWSSNPEYIQPLFDTGIGNVMLGGSIVAGLVGFLWMKKIITIEI